IPWKECSVMDERLKFVARRLAGEPLAGLWREVGISRKNGYKIFDRYQDCGVEGLTDRSRRPYRYANKLPFQVENFILNVKREHSSWGARKIRERLIRRFSDIQIPDKSTIHAVLARHGLVERRGRLRCRAQGTALSLGQRPNELWCTDYKGEFLLGNRQYCYPLTVTDHASRFLLTCEALSSPREDYALTVLERIFKERGLPASIRSDQRVPFAYAQALFNWIKLAVWWLRLAIGIERIKPGHPQQNGRQERMHLTLKKETTKPAGSNFLQQQAKFNDFIEIFHNERPHEALEKPFRPKMLPMSQVRCVTHVLGLDPTETGAPGEIRTPDPLVRSQMLYPAELRARATILPKFLGGAAMCGAWSSRFENRHAGQYESQETRRRTEPRLPQ